MKNMHAGRWHKRKNRWKAVRSSTEEGREDRLTGGEPTSEGTNSAQGQAFSDGNDGSLRCLLKHLGSNYDTHYEAGKGLLKTQPS